ncbi:Uncharacterised protein [Streptococcus equi subsp. zooepidemicus]|uniref:Uncharacterized protein n=1 Tax=Streptococcus equi subsp. ruminatorum CECT 5772 TaxID=1051981 RepID=A0A922T7E7_9STRE|nr:hypothetical protein CECT5772_03304 [Streptococcus equi subsp. ruminatorum CECT 5772]SQF06409.1 Uncharacterised protein [Streptococcus equi subsp. zooepidemicus]
MKLLTFTYYSRNVPNVVGDFLIAFCEKTNHLAKT